MTDLYLKYVSEREGLSYIEQPEGFATYKIVNPTTVYLQDIFVKPECRKKGIASSIADKVADQAKEAGCNTMIGSVCVDAIGCTDSLKVLLAYGFKLKHLSGNMIYMIKEI